MRKKMTSKLLATKRPPTPKEKTLEDNKINGADAEAFAGARLLAACRGEIKWGSRSEDFSKIDLNLSLPHPFVKGERIIQEVQVKSGNRYGSSRVDGFDLKEKASEDAIRNVHDICLIWIDRTGSKCWWYFVHPNTNVELKKCGEHHTLTPAFRYDLARCIVMRKRCPLAGGTGVILGKVKDVKLGRQIAKAFFASHRVVSSALFGKVELTRLGWRHMFRSGRRKNYKEQSLRVIPYLAELLGRRPTNHAVLGCSFTEMGNWIHRSSEHLLVYSKVAAVMNSDTNPTRIKVFIRIIEEIRYPRDWADTAMLSQVVESRAVLESSYFKCTNG